MGPVKYTVKMIDGDYAVLVTENGDENRVALFLLPEIIDEGSILMWENLEYRQIG